MDELLLYKRAWESLAAQICDPKTTARELAEEQLRKPGSVQPPSFDVNAAARKMAFRMLLSVGWHNCKFHHGLVSTERIIELLEEFAATLKAHDIGWGEWT